MIYAAVIGPLRSRADITFFLGQLTAANVYYLRQAAAAGAPFAPLYASGVRYEREHERGPLERPERWRTIPVLHARRIGDCEDLACARAAELQQRGIDAQPELIHAAPGLWHIVVRLPGGRMEDPSRRLGMSSNEVAGYEEVGCATGAMGTHGVAGVAGVEGRALRRFVRVLGKAERVVPLRRIATGVVRGAATLYGGPGAGRLAGGAAQQLLGLSNARRSADAAARARRRPSPTRTKTPTRTAQREAKAHYGPERDASPFHDELNEMHA